MQPRWEEPANALVVSSSKRQAAAAAAAAAAGAVAWNGTLISAGPWAGHERTGEKIASMTGMLGQSADRISRRERERERRRETDRQRVDRARASYAQ